MKSITSREKQVLSLVALGLNDNQIAEKLSLSKKTVQGHLTRVYTKLKAKNRCEAIFKYLVELGGSLVGSEDENT